jgi:peptidoglycan/LPS O-acetylase OafA/YrhL
VAIGSIALGLQAVGGAAVWGVPFTALVMLLIMSLALESGADSFLAHPLLRWIGAISYPLYLWHLWGLAIGRKMPLPGWGQLFVAVLASILLASVSYYLLERPILRWRDSSRHDFTEPTTLEPAPS